MLPMPSAEPFDSEDYAFEVSWDGVRALASIDGGQGRLWGRDLRDLTDRYPEVQALAALAPPETIVDGELIVTDADGRPDGVALEARQQALRPETVARAAAAHPATYVVYDLLYMRGKSLTKEPLFRRRPKVYQSIASDGRTHGVEPGPNDGLPLSAACEATAL